MTVLQAGRSPGSGLYPRPYASRRMQVSDAEQQRAGHDRWLVSYSDFMTLLMAFFVVMYSISQVSEQKYRVLSQTFSDAFKSPEQLETLVNEGSPQLSHTPTPVDLDGNALQDRPGNDATEVPETFVRIEEQLQQSFQDLIDNELINVNGDERWLQIELPSSVLFKSGGIALSEPATAVVGELAAALGAFNNVVRVEGFTDNVPIRGGEFDSNWELSAARASTVVKLLVEAGIEPSRLAAVGYGEHQPVATNETDEGRARNRRIVLMVSTQDRLRDDVFAPPPEPVDEVYPDRPALPEGTLVRGLDRDALQEARDWLNARYPGLAGTGSDDVQSDTVTEAPVRAEPRSASLPVNPGIDTVQLENGAIRFTRSEPAAPAASAQ